MHNHWFWFYLTSAIPVILISNDPSLPSTSASHSQDHMLDFVITYPGDTLATSRFKQPLCSTTFHVTGLSHLVTWVLQGAVLQPSTLRLIPFPSSCSLDIMVPCYKHSLANTLTFSFLHPSCSLAQTSNLDEPRHLPSLCYINLTALVKITSQPTVSTRNSWSDFRSAAATLQTFVYKQAGFPNAQDNLFQTSPLFSTSHILTLSWWPHPTVDWENSNHLISTLIQVPHKQIHKYIGTSVAPLPSFIHF